jgi:hypothetical protein
MSTNCEAAHNVIVSNSSHFLSACSQELARGTDCTRPLGPDRIHPHWSVRLPAEAHVIPFGSEGASLSDSRGRTTCRYVSAHCQMIYSIHKHVAVFTEGSPHQHTCLPRVTSIQRLLAWSLTLNFEFPSQARNILSSRLAYSPVDAHQRFGGT